MARAPIDLLTLIQDTNPRRKMSEILRRVVKVQEECGELAEAILGVTSQTNSKKKRWADVREEALDVAIVALDVALTPLFVDKLNFDIECGDEARDDLLRVAQKKLNKWKRAQKKRKHAIT